MNKDRTDAHSRTADEDSCIKFGENIVYILILTLALNRTTPATMTTAEFSSRTNCEDAALAWKTQARITFSNALLTTVCQPR